jgi:hypothetical protein
MPVKADAVLIPQEWKPWINRITRLVNIDIPEEPHNSRILA